MHLFSSFPEAPHTHLHKMLIELYMYDFDSVFFINANYFAKYISFNWVFTLKINF